MSVQKMEGENVASASSEKYIYIYVIEVSSSCCWTWLGYKCWAGIWKGWKTGKTGWCHGDP